ncbi:MAG: hypothetical protein A2600_07395 [Candidatus Lambdaproteobacteria bacterium RIFOXYD1_FULL_56_27]|uniref:J domain-containing protein n=1 Tax=Candidatus Lambdaproteobacteria bacterium RIFOXYD2_FULL_56_26 TaxID=1817773 RepID=A0A1F6GVE3_9PROT|nr:MAG: hypothetical protein A2557_05350 [Candidatus Lambdaproteobacteria bacterium RIFOXYD2_FULL_56_26]OGH03754.1 MAG: hypothetical protein A2426_00845 [Candidatus Lambdaproteobacteria bacterium RIFOXYC1_FULL_56_13]OGH07338.1 MAG: hypothetical protein A2600_07395 [Candidatus Lambdaproteobacteria bacterium RIFOXYD1_FULL_56_27]
MTRNPKELLEQVVITYSLKHLPCSKAECLTCLTTQGHGPYWYAHFTLAGAAKDVFLGRSFKPMDLTQILMGEILGGKKLAEVQKEEQARAYERAQAQAQLGPQESLKEQNDPNPPSAQAKTADHHIDRIGAVWRKPVLSPKPTPTAPPNQRDFEQDMALLKGAGKSENLKFIYRKLIKKYHPDQFGSNKELDQWMSLINGTYHQLLAARR